MGKFPVISISLRGIEGTTFQEAKEMLTHRIGLKALRHQYLMDSDKLTKYDKQKLEQLLSGEFSETILKNSLLILSQLLHKHHNQKVIILIDEYDVPLAKAYEHNLVQRLCTNKCNKI